jgi:hypothetical protein
MNQLSINIANAIRANRVTNTELVLSNIELSLIYWNLPKYRKQNHHKACWILELVRKTALFDYRFSPVFCQCLNTFKHESAIRAIAKFAFS